VVINIAIIPAYREERGERRENIVISIKIDTTI